MVDRKTMGFAVDRKVRSAADRSPAEDREEILREWWSDSFSNKLREIVQRAIGAETQSHKEAGRELPVTLPAKAKARTAGG